MVGHLLNCVLGVLHCSIFVGFKFQITSPLHAFHGILSRDSDTETANQGALDEYAMVPEASPQTVPIAESGNVTSGTSN